MGVCIWRCNKDQENIIKESSIDCYKKTDQSLIPNIITSNNVNANEDDKKLIKLKYNKIFNDPKEKECLCDKYDDSKISTEKKKTSKNLYNKELI